MNRRELLQGVGAAAVLMPMNGVTWATGLRTETIAVFDSRYPQAARFAAGFTAAGGTALPAEDVLQQWYRSLRSIALDVGSRIRIAGMTTHSDYLVLRDCAREEGWRVLFEGIHDARHSPQVTHTLRGRTTDRCAADACVSSDGDWSRHLAWGLCATEFSSSSLTSLPVSTRAASHAGGDAPVSLTSWALGAL